MKGPTAVRLKTAARQAATLGAVVLGLALAVPAPAEAEVALTRQQMLGLSLKYLNAGDAAMALAVANAVLKVDPDDPQAQVMRARALMALGQREAAEAAAQRAWDNADTDGEKFDAAMAMGETRAVLGNQTTGQFWFRRASDYAPTPTARQVAVNAFRAVRRENPWSFSVSAGLSPNKNVNNASTAETIDIITIFGTLPFTPVIYSGMTANGSVGASYRFSHADQSVTVIGVSGSARVNWLDTDSRERLDTNLDPDDSYHDFDYAALAATLSHSRPAAGGLLTLSGRVGHSWYGWESYDNSLAASAEWRRDLGDGNSLALFSSASAQLFSDPVQEDAYTFEAGTRLGHRFADGSELNITFAGNRTTSDDDTKVWYGGRAGIDFDLGKPVLGAELSFGASLGYRYYPADLPAYGATDRTDWLLGLQGEAVLPQLGRMGFAPVFNVSWDANRSSLPAYEREGLKFGVGLRSNF